jgi:hypothetical protein
VSEAPHCINHPDVETYLRCNRCGSPICPKCAVRTEVGYRCGNCINRQQQVFYAEFRPIYYAVAAAVALPLGLIAGWIIPALGWFSIFLGPLAGLGISEVAHRAIGRRRGRHTWLVVAGCILAGGIPWLLTSLVPFVLGILNSRLGLGGVLPLVWGGVYLVTAVGAATARLRTGRRR